jgi:uncharacterized membrane protein
MGDTLRTSMRLAVALLMAFLVPADAALTVCNKSAHGVKVAVGRFDGVNWMSKGWWALAPKACAPVVEGALDSRFYYLYATDGGSASWDGPRSFCVAASDKFEIAGRTHCQARGFDRRGFFEVDTGRRMNYTQSFSD